MGNKWYHKLTSRKLWLAITGLISQILIIFGYSDSTATQISAIIMSGATVIAYIIGEGLIDAAAANSSSSNNQTKAEGESSK